MNIDIERRGDVTILRPSGDVDLGRSPALRESLKLQLDSSPSKLVVDLTGVPYMDSSGVATLVEALQISRRAGSELVLCSLQPKVRSVFEIARLDSVFRIEQDVEAASAG